MKQLNIQDAGFIYQETGRTPMHISGLGIYCQREGARKSTTAEDTIAYIEDRIHACPILQQKLLHVPGQWERPYWIHDPQFDIRQHVFFHQLPAPGNRQQLFALVSELMSGNLDMYKPLWQCHVIDGLHNVDGIENGFAILTKVHHSCVDGSAGSNIMMVLHDMAPDAESLFTASPVPEQIIPGRYEMMARAYANTLRDGFTHSWKLTRKLPAITRIAADVYRGKQDTGAQLSVPATRFNKTPEAERVFTSVDFSLADIKAVKNTASMTINDVMVAIVAGGLRQYLHQLGELPEATLGAMLPKNIRQESAREERRGNQVGGLITSLHTDIDDTLQRLQAIQQSTAKAKQFAEQAGTDHLFAYLMGGALYPRVAKSLTRWMHQNRVMEKIGPVLFNTIITNVPGPNFMLYHDGARMTGFAGVPPLPDGVALAHAIYSYNDRISLSVLSCPGMLEQPEVYGQCLTDSLMEIRKALNV